MAIEQTEVPNPPAQRGFLQSLNFLKISETAPSSSKTDVSITRPEVSNRARRSNDQSFSEILDFSAPVYPAEKTLQKNKYEAAIAEQVADLDSEAKFTDYTRDALKRDADRFPSMRNANGTTIYTLEQLGLSDRDLKEGQTTAQPYKRLVTITMPDTAASLKDCKFEYQDRQNIDVTEFNQLITDARKRQVEQSATAVHKVPRSEDIAFFTHGIRTAAVSSDFYSLALQLTNGHCVINVDWQSTPPSEEKVGLSQAYENERRGAAQSYPKFEKALDDVINVVGPDRTILIAFSHGAMFDTNYLQHRKDSQSPLVGQVIFSHPDVKASTLPQPDKDGKIDEANRFYSRVARDTRVIGSPRDLALMAAAVNECEPSKSEDAIERARHNTRQMEIHARLGSGAPICRTLVAGSGGTYVLETIPKDKRDFSKHFINMNGIAELINGNNGEKTLKIASDSASVEK